MKRNAVLAVLVVVLAGLLVLVGWLMGQGAWGGDGQEPLGPGEPRTKTLAGGTREPANEEPQARADASRRALEKSDPDLAPEVILVGRCLEDTTPLAGVKIELNPVEPTPALKLYRFQHPDMKWAEEPVIVHSGGDGRFELRLHTPGVFRGWQLKFVAEDRVPRWWYPDELAAGRHDLGDIQLRRGCALSGAVRDEQGRPQAGVRIYLSRQVDWDKEIVESFQMKLRSASDGTFRAVEPLVPTKWRVRVMRAQLPDEQPLYVDLTDKTFHDLQIRVRNPEDVDRISGTILDEAERPLTPSSVHFEPTGDYRSTSWARTETNGSFLVLRRPRDPKGKVTLIITPRGRPEHRVPDVAWNTTDLRIVVPPQPGLELIVREADTGKPVEHYGVLHRKKHPRLGFNSAGPLEHVEPHPAGRLVITGMAQGQHRLTVVPRDPGLAWSEPYEVDVGNQPLEPLMVALPRQGERSVLVVDAAGHAVASVRLQLLRHSFTERHQSLAAVDPLSGDSASGRRISVLERESVTDAGGRAILRGNPSQPHALRVLPAQHQPQILWDVIPDPRFGELRVVLDRGCVVRGRVEPAELWPRFARGTSKAGFKVRSQVRDTIRRMSLLATPDAQGRFLIAGLPPGGAEMSMTWYHPDGKEPDPEVTTVYRWSALPTGRPAEIVIDLRQFYPVQVQGLATCNGRLLPNAQITLSVVREFEGNPEAIDGCQTTTDAKGRYVGRAIPGNWKAYWYPPTKGASTPGIEVQLGSVAAGSRTMDLAFESGALDLTLLRSDGTPVVGVHVAATPKGIQRRTTTLRRTDAQGRTTLAHITPGQYDLWMWPKSLADGNVRRKVLGSDKSKVLEARVPLGTVHVARGGVVEKPITLPAKAGY